MEFVDSIIFVALVVLLACLSAVDLRERRLPNRLVLAVAALGLLLAVTQCFYESSPLPLQGALLGVLLAAGPACLFSLLYYFLRGYAGFGMGDLKLLAALGLYLGPVGMWVLVLACLIAVLVMLCQMVFGFFARLFRCIEDQQQTVIEKVRGRTIALGPFIAVAAVILVLFS